MDAMKLQQWPHLIYVLGETGLKLTYSSGNQKLSAVKGSKNSQCYSLIKRINCDSSGLHECKGKQLDSPNGSV
jgi:hypothetical protein